MSNRKPSGFIIYEGPSLIDGGPIVCIATRKSRNRKTGNMVQTWVLRSDMTPIEANRMGADHSVCGNCPHAGIVDPAKKTGTRRNRSCYVLIMTPQSIYRAYKRGSYPVVRGHQRIADLGRGRMVRIGAYGDGAAVPSYVNESLISEAAGHTAYSHQSNVPQSSFDGARFMVSADTEAAARDAWANGWRTFRVLRANEQPIAGKEIACPSVKGVHCIDCGLCRGAHKTAKSITIPVHGSGAVHVS